MRRLKGLLARRIFWLLNFATFSMRRLIINANDFGLTAGVNKAIVEAHREGVVTSSTLMASSRAFDAAVELAKSAPGLGVGCHVTLVDAIPLVAPEKVASLLARRGSAHFATGIAEFAGRALR